MKEIFDKLKGVKFEDDPATRKSLISRLRSLDDSDSWTEFFNVYWRLIYSTARAAGLSSCEAEDAVQETVISVSRAMPAFRYNPEKGHFRSWLFQLTRWRIKDQFRKRGHMTLVPISSHGPDEEGEFIDEQLTILPDLETKWNQEWEENLIYAAIERVRGRVDSRQFQVFELAVLQKWPTPKIKSFLRVSGPLIYVTKRRLRRSIKKEFEHLKTECF